MPIIRVYLAASLDGYIARPDGGLDWLPAPDALGEDYGYAALMERTDALVMGRHTYDTVRGFEEWPYGEKPVLVLTSRSLAEPPVPGAQVRAWAATPAEVAAALDAEGVQGVYLDGGVTVQAFLRAGLVDELTITRVPVLLGAGRPLFGTLPADVPLIHEATHAYPNGLVQSRYRVPR